MSAMHPKTILYTSEQHLELRPCPFANNMTAYWSPQRPGEGDPIFGQMHQVRQRKWMIRELCDVCGKPLRNKTRISLAERRVIPEYEAPVAVEPFVCKRCAEYALHVCPHLRRRIEQENDKIVLRVRRWVPIASTAAWPPLEEEGAAANGGRGAVGYIKAGLVEYDEWPLSRILGSKA